MKRILSNTGAVSLLAAVSMASLSFAQPGPGFDPNAPGGPGNRRGVAPGGPGNAGGQGGPGNPGGPGVPNPGPGGFIPGRRPGVPVPILPVPPRPPVPPDDGAALVAQVQRKLKRLGYYQGVVDGEMGRGTRGAIRAFQNENGLADTGAIDRPLLRALGL